MNERDHDHNIWPLGAFARVDVGLGVSLEMAGQLGVATCHLHVPARTHRTSERAAAIREQLARLGLTVTCVFAGFDGESYADIPTVRRTVGLAPAETRAARTIELLEIAAFARAIGVPAVGLHLGFVPHDATGAEYRPLVDVTRQACDVCAAASQTVHLETGQEPVDVLLRLIADVGCENLFVNFDPANMILYGAGEPLPALRALAPHVRSVHCKDAKWSDRPGETWGRETPLGEGDVNFTAFLSALRAIGYDGPLTVERENAHDPAQQMADMRAALELLEGLKRSILRR
jgi:sugar phosphate isomerase/epimerase